MADLQAFDRQDACGLICGYELPADRPPVRLAAPPDAAARPTSPIWLHFSLADMRARKWIAACEAIAPLGRDLLLGSDAHVRMTSTRAHLFGAIGDVHYEFDTDPDKFGSLFVYVDERRVITGRHHPLKAVDQLRYEMDHCVDPVGGPFAVLSRLLGLVADGFDALTGQLGESVDVAEDSVLKDRHDHVGDELAQIRRVLARLRRHVMANRQSLARALPTLPSGCSAAEAAEFRAAVDRFEATSHDLELVQDRARLLQEEIARRLNESTSRNLYFLSIVTAIFLPITLITGVFGMNVGGLPWLEHSGGFWWVVVLMAATVVGTLAVLRWRNLY